MARFKKTDIEFHYDYGRSYPAINIKVHKWFPRDVDWTDPELYGLTQEWVENHLTDDEVNNIFCRTCKSELEYFMDWLKEEFPGADLQVTGRSGGWLEAHKLPDVESWDAIMVSKWGKFVRIARDIADEIPQRMAESIAINEYDWWLGGEEEKASENAAANLPILVNV